MPYRIGGYFPTVYKVMETLEMPNPFNYDDTMLEFTINYRLCEQDKKDILAAYIRWKDDGLGDLEESGRDKAIVKEWLIKGAGVKAEELKWITLVDNRRITINGIQPRKVLFRKSTKTPSETMAELKEAGRMRDLEIASGVFDNDID